MNQYKISNTNHHFFYSDNNFIISSIEKLFDTKLVARGETIKIIAQQERKDVVSLFKMIEDFLILRPDAKVDDVISLIKIKKSSPEITVKELLTSAPVISYGRKPIYPKSLNQQLYLHYINNNDVVFGIGPAGTGKTYLAMAVALKYLVDKEVNKIILTRPAVEAGENLGFLPGDLEAKINPYLRPLYDALYDILPADIAAKYLERGQIELAPLAYMRGRTLNDAFLILDEAQNTTVEQMKMFLTRIGFNSKAVITGDITQIDLPPKRMSGLVQTTKILGGVKGIKFAYFNDKDVVRHEIVQRIIKAYQKFEDSKGKN
jgi:phosphate starvation-inducible PhoH-like protein